MRVLVMAVLVLQAVQAPMRQDAGETYAAVSVDRNGNLAIRKTDGSIVAVYRRPTQTTFEDPRVSPDRAAVGAQGMYPNCCGTYDIPLRLVVYENGREHWFKGDELPIFRWTFVDGGRRVAYAQEPVHFDCGVHYELRDVRSERLIEEVNVPTGFPACPEPKAGSAPIRVPDWAKPLVVAR